MKFKKPNLYNSATLQAMLDIRTALDQLGYTYDNINDIIEEMQEEKSDIRKLSDDIYYRHRYADKSRKFTMVADYDACPERFELPHIEVVILDLLGSIQDQNGKVKVYKKHITDVLHLTYTERRNLQTYIDHLTEMGFLTALYRPEKGSTKPGVYIVNKKVIWVGRCDDDISSNPHIPGFNQQYTRINEQVALPDGTKSNCGTLGIYTQKRASAEHTDSTAEPYTDSEFQNNFNTDSMLNSSDLLTPGENELFKPEER